MCLLARCDVGILLLILFIGREKWVTVEAGETVELEKVDHTPVGITHLWNLANECAVLVSSGKDKEGMRWESQEIRELSSTEPCVCVCVCYKTRKSTERNKESIWVAPSLPPVSSVPNQSRIQGSQFSRDSFASTVFWVIANSGTLYLWCKKISLDKDIHFFINFVLSFDPVDCPIFWEPSWPGLYFFCPEPKIISLEWQG